MITLSFVVSNGVQVVFILVCGALAWRLIWAILVTPRLDRIFREFERPPIEESPRIRVAVRDPRLNAEVIESEQQKDPTEVNNSSGALPRVLTGTTHRVRR